VKRRTIHVLGTNFKFISSPHPGNAGRVSANRKWRLISPEAEASPIASSMVGLMNQLANVSQSYQLLARS
jgi:hypothetical protein